MPTDVDKRQQVSPPLVAVTDLKDVRLTRIEAWCPDEPVVDSDIRVGIENIAFRAEAGTLYAQVTSVAHYLRPQGDPEEEAEPGAAEDAGAAREEVNEAEQAELARITLVHTAQLSLDDDPDSVTMQRFQEFVDNNLFFMLFPYVRSATSRTANDLGLPATVLPFLRRRLPTDDPEEPGTE